MKKKRQNKHHKLFIALAIFIAIAIVVFMLQDEEAKRTLLSLGGILPFGDKSIYPPALPE